MAKGPSGLNRYSLFLATGPTRPSLGRAIRSRAVSPTDSRATAVTASQTLQATARAATALLTDRPRTVSLSQGATPPLPVLNVPVGNLSSAEMWNVSLQLVCNP